MRKKNLAAALADDEDVPQVKRSRKKEVVDQSRPIDPIHSKRVCIMLEENENIPPTGQFFGINGRSYMLRPGEKAMVPQEIIEVLENAVQEVPQIDPTTTQVVGYRKKLRFPYRIITADRQAA